ncbi:MAG: DUF1937 family protein [Candidatus Harrisonbacteria bacterium]|nr:DUF1937 family protein [Candidatus Harrisonbacteria bacterium]
MQHIISIFYPKLTGSPINFSSLVETFSFFAPHSHTARFERLAQAPEAYYHALDDAIYDLSCEAFVLLPGWKHSNGAKRDRERAIQRGKPVFPLESYNNSAIEEFLASLKSWARQA